MGHRIQRIRYDNQDAVWRELDNLFGNRFHNLRVCVQQIVTAHARFPSYTGRDDDNIGIRGLLITVCSNQSRVITIDRRGFGQIQSLALRNTIDNIDENYVAELLICKQLRSAGAYANRIYA